MSKLIGNRLKELRERAGLTLEDVGKKIGVSRATAQRYESGAISGIPYDKIEKLAELYHVSPGYIMGWLELKVDAPDLKHNFYDRSKFYEVKLTDIFDEQEIELLANFHKLNDVGKNAILSVLRTYVDMPDFAKKEESAAGST